MEAIVAAWAPNVSPWSEFRLPLCAKCGAEIAGPCFHVWHPDRRREIHLCYGCGSAYPNRENTPEPEPERGQTLIVVAARDESFAANLPSLRGGPVCVIDTSQGGWSSGGFLRGYRGNPGYDGYLFLQDSMSGTEPDVVAPFLGQGPVVAWCRFGFFFDNPEQADWVRSQYPNAPDPEQGIWGPVFYATAEALAQAEPFFPAVPGNRLQAQGSERAWAFCFQQAGLPVTGLHERDPRGATEPLPPFSKTFANRD